MPNKKKKIKKQSKFKKVFIYLISIIIVFSIAPNYEKSDNYYIKEKINLIINNENVTKNLKQDIFINNKDVIYISIEDVSNYFDKTVNYDEKSNKVITNYGEKIVELPVGKNIIEINNREQDVLDGAISKDGIYYIPIDVMENVYELDIKYIEDEQMLLIDSLIKKLVKADVSKKCSVKYKATVYSKTIDKVMKAEKVIVIEHLENNWTKIRTKKGKIGYVKTNVLQNEVYIRDDLYI